MGDLRLIRLQNLKAVVKQRGLTQKMLSQMAGGRVSYWSDLLRGQKSFGEQVARHLEDSLDPPLPPYWLDMAHGADEAPPLFGGAIEDAMRAVGSRSATLAALRAELVSKGLPPDKLAKHLAAVDGLMSDMERHEAAPPAAQRKKPLS